MRSICIDGTGKTDITLCIDDAEPLVVPATSAAAAFSRVLADLHLTPDDELHVTTDAGHITTTHLTVTIANTAAILAGCRLFSVHNGVSTPVDTLVPAYSQDVRITQST